MQCPICFLLEQCPAYGSLRSVGLKHMLFFNIKQFQNRITSEDLFYFGKRQFLFCFPLHSLATVSFGEFCDWPNYLGTVCYELPNKIYCAAQCSHALFVCRSWCILDFLNVCLCRFNLSVTNDKSQKFELEKTKPGFRGFNLTLASLKR